MLNKKRLLKLFVLCLMLVGNVVFAHQLDLSNVIISKTNNGQVILQINSSLTAFQDEINYNNGQGSYKSPEEFQNLVLQHFKANFSFIVNKQQPLQFNDAKVFLGHETKIVTEIMGLPDTINTVFLKNEMFEDIYNNQSIVIFLLEGFPKEKYTLDNNHGHELNIALNDGKWENLKAEQASFNIGYIFLLLILISILIFIYLKFVKQPRHFKHS
ncbi:hypothetical protein [Arenibacter echinorum]|uniref:LPXTG-motif cell wall-anchored protein n=1 Tax=Arenibacter echinorum TaxID=440515 RepID=A0A327R849_9FLAO|nr:hypothetical protein [Arenibacter echinorum]RAJ12298.1 hypothetical protein LV92_01531 [Arenibacter echinorum]